MDYLEARTSLTQTKLNTSLADIVAGTNQLFSLQDIEDAIQFGCLKAWDYKPWTFTQGKQTVTLTTPLTTPFSYPNTMADESIFLVVVNGVPWSGPQKGKRTFADYQLWLSNYPTDTSLIWSEYGRLIYLNPNACSVGQSADLYGKSRFTKLSGDTDLLPFSPNADANEDSGNQAIIKLAYSFLLASDKKQDFSNSAMQAKEAYADLDILWGIMGEKRAEMQPQNRPMFNTQDMFNKNRSTRFDTNIGNFP